MRVFNIIFGLLGCMAFPFLFFYQFYGPFLNYKDFGGFLILATAVGISVKVSLIIICGVLIKLLKKEQYKSKEFQIFFTGLNGIFCMLVFYVPFCVKLISPNYSGYEAVLGILHAQSVGVGVALAAYVIKLVVSRGKKV
jgi:hypothetical protein